MDSTKDNKLYSGKYAGYSYHDVLKKDLNYAKFMMRLPSVQPCYQEFVQFCNDNINSYEEEKTREAIEKLLRKKNIN